MGLTGIWGSDKCRFRLWLHCCPPLWHWGRLLKLSGPQLLFCTTGWFTILGALNNCLRKCVWRAGASKCLISMILFSLLGQCLLYNVLCCLEERHLCKTRPWLFWQWGLGLLLAQQQTHGVASMQLAYDNVGGRFEEGSMLRPLKLLLFCGL
jgi:hypothetical protein